MWFLQLLAAAVLLSLGSSMMTGGLPPVKFHHMATLDQEGAFVMLWTPLEKEIHIEIQVATRGFIGLGFSPSGGMKGADIVLAWIDDFTGELHVHDRYAVGNMMPYIDDQHDINVVGGYQNDTHTVLRFSRLWNTCDDPQDLKLSGDTTRVIWSYSYEDPLDEMNLHIHDKRGTKSIYLREPQFSLPEFSEDVKSIDLLIPKVTLPDDLDTLYWCQIYHIPNLVSKNHLIGYIPIIQEGNHEEVHHILLNECHLDLSSEHYEKWLTSGGRQCLTASMPPSWYYCQHTIIAWAVGSEGEMFPEHVGLPLGKEYGGSDYYMIQMHYDNPKLKKGVVDNSGLRLFYTDQPRDIDGGVLMLGGRVEPTMMIPPRQNWHTVGICPGECTQEGLPEEGIKVMQGLLHAHLLGRAIAIRHIRNGIELPTVFKDMNYDFNYQQTRVLKEEMVVKPGDTLIVECNHDATRKAKPTFGGEDTDDEMCLAYLTYYPRMGLSLCLSSPDLPVIYKALGIQDIYHEEKIKTKFGVHGSNKIIDEETIKARDRKFLENPNTDFENVDFALVLKDVVAKYPAEYSNRTLYDILHDLNTFKDPKIVEELQNQMNYGDHRYICRGANRKELYRSDMVRYPDFVKFKSLEDDECAASSQQEKYVPYEKAKPKPVSETGSHKKPSSNAKVEETSAASSPASIFPAVYTFVYLLCKILKLF